VSFLYNFFKRIKVLSSQLFLSFLKDGLSSKSSPSCYMHIRKLIADFLKVLLIRKTFSVSFLFFIQKFSMISFSNFVVEQDIVKAN
jgi:hypothetical protein